MSNCICAMSLITTMRHVKTTQHTQKKSPACTTNSRPCSITKKDVPYRLYRLSVFPKFFRNHRSLIVPSIRLRCPWTSTEALYWIREDVDLGNVNAARQSVEKQNISVHANVKKKSTHMLIQFYSHIPNILPRQYSAKRHGHPWTCGSRAICWNLHSSHKENAGFSACWVLTNHKASDNVSKFPQRLQSICE